MIIAMVIMIVYCYRYYDITTEVLTSVKRTEDSLQKLKRSRRSLPLESQPSSTSSSGVMSDDNKIRLQLACDIDQYLEQVGTIQQAN